MWNRVLGQEDEKFKHGISFSNSGNEDHLLSFASCQFYYGSDEVVASVQSYYK